MFNFCRKRKPTKAQEQEAGTEGRYWHYAEIEALENRIREETRHQIAYEDADGLKHYMIVGFRMLPVNSNESKIVNEADNPIIYNTFSSAFRVMNELYGTEDYDIRNTGEQLSIVELKTIIPYGVNPDVPPHHLK